MTVIVASRTAMFADTKCSGGGSSYRTPKIFRHKKELIGVSGSNKDIALFLDWYTNGRKGTCAGKKYDIVVVNRYGIFAFCGAPFPDRILDDYYYAGAGGPIAKAAMLAGADPRRAIEIAAQVHDACGLPVQEEKL